MRVGGHLVGGQHVRCLAALACHAVGNGAADVGVDRGCTLQIGQGEGADAVTAKGGPEDREQRLVLCDGQQLPVAGEPAARNQAEGEKANLANEGF